MSYIHEALKKAQVERDLGKGPYGGIMAPQRKKTLSTLKKTILWAIPLLMVLLAFAAYSWWDLKDETWDVGTSQSRRVNPPHDRRASPSLSGSAKKPMPAAVPRPQVENRESVAVCYEKARALHREGRLPGAGVWYEKVIAMDPGHVQALNNLGVLRLHEKDYPMARRYFEKAIHLKPDYVDPYYNLACVFAATGQVDRGLRYLGKAINMDPNVKGWAQKDPDLDPLRSSPLFQEMVVNKK